jgi:hypothetical protein
MACSSYRVTSQPGSAAAAISGHCRHLILEQFVEQLSNFEPGDGSATLPASVVSADVESRYWRSITISVNADRLA